MVPGGSAGAGLFSLSSLKRLYALVGSRTLKRASRGSRCRLTRLPDSRRQDNAIHRASNQTSGFRRSKPVQRRWRRGGNRSNSAGSTSSRSARLRAILSFVLQQLPRLDLEPLRDASDVVDRHVAFRAFDRTQVGPVDSASAPGAVRRITFASTTRPPATRVTFPPVPTSIPDFPPAAAAPTDRRTPAARRCRARRWLGGP